MKITWGKALSMWWGFLWRALLLGLVVGIGVGVLVVAVTAVGQPALANLLALISFVFSVFLSVIAMKWTVEKHLESLVLLSGDGKFAV